MSKRVVAILEDEMVDWIEVKKWEVFETPLADYLLRAYPERWEEFKENTEKKDDKKKDDKKNNEKKKDDKKKDEEENTENDEEKTDDAEKETEEKKK